MAHQLNTFVSAQALIRFAEEQVVHPRLDSLINDSLLCYFPTYYKKRRIPYASVPNDLSSKYQPEQEISKILCAAKREKVETNGLQPAPFPAVSACCATLEFFSGLAFGNELAPNFTEKQFGGRKRKTSHFNEFSKRFLGYQDYQCRLLIAGFRNKVAHLSMPSPTIVLKEKLEARTKGRRVRIRPGQGMKWRLAFYYENDHLRLDTSLRQSTLHLAGMKGVIRAKYYFTFSVLQFLNDFCEGILGKWGYLEMLKRSAVLQHNFDVAMTNLYHPQRTPQPKPKPLGQVLMAWRP